MTKLKSLSGLVPQCVIVHRLARSIIPNNHFSQASHKQKVLEHITFIVSFVAELSLFPLRGY